MQETDFRKIKTPLSAKITVADQRYLYFGGTAYLGIPQNKAFIKQYLRGINYFGLNNGTSRNNNIQLDIYNEAEQVAATQYGAAAGLITSSGYLAAQLAIKELSVSRQVRYAPTTHPALWINETPGVNDSFNSWTKKVVLEINNSPNSDWVIISNAMNNLYPEVYDFSFIEQLNKDKKIILIVDDSHGIGVNNEGRGAFATLPKAKNIESVVIASMAKALGVDAGLILSSKKIISRLKQTNMFLGASPPSAAGLFAFINAAAIYKEELEKLKGLTEKFSKTLKENDLWSFIADFPVFLALERDIDKKLLQHRILISSFPYPDKYGDLINRVVLSSWHSQKNIQKLIASLRK
ncbi:MAG: aminotransferase class I/II-fold pyridoxal phosphate-dependent enzyme [Bacteroidota bacterium]